MIKFSGNKIIICTLISIILIYFIFFSNISIDSLNQSSTGISISPPKYTNTISNSNNNIDNIEDDIVYRVKLILKSDKDNKKDYLIQKLNEIEKLNKDGYESNEEKSINNTNNNNKNNNKILSDNNSNYNININNDNNNKNNNINNKSINNKNNFNEEDAKKLLIKESNLDPTQLEIYKMLTTSKSIQSAHPHSFDSLHFIHIPKCGGTTFTSVLRQFQCVAHPEYHHDCCLNIGHCSPKEGRSCNSVKGCYSHYPNSNYIDKPFLSSVAMFREPVSRLLSAWFYHGHNPNMDYFSVREEFKLIREGKLPKKTFKEYLEMPEYNNIMTRMIGLNSFPYRDREIDNSILNFAIRRLNKLYFVGLQEEYSLSIAIFARMYFRDHALYHKYIYNKYGPNFIYENIDQNENTIFSVLSDKLALKSSYFTDQLDFYDRLDLPQDTAYYLENKSTKTPLAKYFRLTASSSLKHYHNASTTIAPNHFSNDESLGAVPPATTMETLFLQFMNINKKIKAKRKSNPNPEMDRLVSNEQLMERAKEVNSYDILLYKEAVKIFCRQASQFPDIYKKIQENGKVNCND